MTNTLLSKTFICFVFSSIIAFTNSAFADIKVKNSGAYVIERICIDGIDGKICKDMSLPLAQSYTIPSENIPPGGTQLGVGVICAAFLVLPIVHAHGTTSNYIQDGEEVNLSGVCLYFVKNSSANVMPTSNTPMNWNTHR